MLLPLKQYAVFSGRSGRLEYWLFHLLVFVLVVASATVLGGIGQALGFDMAEGSSYSRSAATLVGLVWLGLLMPALAVTVRRLHDGGRSGWFVLLALVPAVGVFLLALLLALPGDNQDNPYGASQASASGSALVDHRADR